MAFYDEMQDVAADVLKEFKQGVIKYIDIEPGSGPVDDPGEPVEKSYTLDGAARGVKYKYVQGGLAVASDLQVTSSVKATDENNLQVSLNPKLNGFVEIDDVRYKIVQVLPKPAAGTTVAFTLIIRK